MKVFYDSTVFSRQTFGGISRYIVELAGHLPEGVESVFAVRASDNHYIRRIPRGSRKRIINLRPVPDCKHFHRIINRNADLREMRRDDYDILHPSDYNTSFVGHNRRPVVVTVHDLILEHLRRQNGGQQSVQLQTMEACILRADHLIAISDTTCRDLEEFYRIPSERVTVIHHGFTPVDVSSAQVSPMRGSVPYILYVGERGGYKNFSGFLKAFRILSERIPELSAVATGRPFRSYEIKEMKELGIKDKVKNIFVRDEDFPGLYAHASCYVMPSLMEGFGMPILEAFAAGCPVALSNTSCMPEIGGDAARYFDPLQPEDMAETLFDIILNDEVADSLRSRATKRLSNFSWEKTGQLTAEVYKKLI